MVTASRWLRGPTCRDADVPHPLGLQDFLQLSYSKCYMQVFFESMPLEMHWPPKPPYHLFHKANPNMTFMPSTKEGRDAVCSTTLSGSECHKWLSCCKAAALCCESMTSRNTTSESGRCSSTWDGVACWPDTGAGHVVSQQCPHFYRTLTYRHAEAHASRTCSENSSWTLHPVLGRVASDYEDCFEHSATIRVLEISLILDVSGHALSLFSLMIAGLLIISSRSLRRDYVTRDSLRLHLNLFIAMAVMSISTISWLYIIYDGLTNEKDPIYERNPVWCRVLHVGLILGRSVTYMAMFSEGLFLSRKISRMTSVHSRESITKYIILTWGLPPITTAAYVITRVATGENNFCWMDVGVGYLEFIYMIPNLISLLCNAIFLGMIEWNLCTRLKCDKGHISDRRNKDLRHAIRATLSLIPVFGLQFVFIVYRPRHQPYYDVIAALLTSTQGFLVAILYCFSTKEVRQEMSQMSQSIPMTGLAERRSKRKGGGGGEEGKLAETCGSREKLTIPNDTRVVSVTSQGPASSTCVTSIVMQENDVPTKSENDGEVLVKNGFGSSEVYDGTQDARV